MGVGRARTFRILLIAVLFIAFSTGVVAGASIVTRGASVNIPCGTLVETKLAEPLRLQ